MGDYADDFNDDGLEAIYRSQTGQDIYESDLDDPAARTPTISRGAPSKGIFKMKYGRRYYNTRYCCKYCEEGPVEWKSVDGKWRLFDMHTNLPHACQPTPTKEA